LMLSTLNLIFWFLRVYGGLMVGGGFDKACVWWCEGVVGRDGRGSAHKVTGLQSVQGPLRPQHPGTREFSDCAH
jgi:hypothetical protein